MHPHLASLVFRKEPRVSSPPLCQEARALGQHLAGSIWQAASTAVVDAVSKFSIYQLLCCAFSAVFNFILVATLGGRHSNHPHFTDGEAEAVQGYVRCPRLCLMVRSA